MNIAITGHRPDAFLISHYSFETIKRIADDMVCVFKREFKDDLRFNLGGGIGVDQWVGRACMENNVKFHLYLPFVPEIQSKYWDEEQKVEFNNQINYASGLEIIDPSGNYNVWNYQKRNEKMIDDSNFVIAFWVNKNRGGTFNAMKYALKQSKFVFNALNELKLVFKENLKGAL